MSFPSMAQLPPFLTGRDLVIITGAILENNERAGQLLAQLRMLEPEIDTFHRIPACALLEVHMDPPQSTPVISEHSVLGMPTDDAIQALLAQVGHGTRSGLRSVELRHLGGALVRPPAHGGALSHLTGDYALLCVAVAPSPEAAVAGRAAARTTVQALARWPHPSRVPTFTCNTEDPSSMFDRPERRAAHGA